jgi:hypothetical protein
MRLDELYNAVAAHRGTFTYTRYGGGASKEIEFRHEFAVADGSPPELPIEELSPFYSTFASLRLYCNPVSGDSAFYIATPGEWPYLEEDLRMWFEGLSEAECAELLPSWIEDCVVIGEIPASGNYLLVPLVGPERGWVFEFEHDGFEFIACAHSVEQFIQQVLDPDTLTLKGMSSHMCFMDGSDPAAQWYIVQMRDNRGNTVCLDA